MDDHLRAADRDREDVVAILREHYAQGRITFEELDARTTTAYAAKTIGDLRPLVADLPATPPATPPEPREAPWSASRRAWTAATGVLVLGVILVAAVAADHALAALPSWLIALIVLRAVRNGRSYRASAARRAARG